MFNTAIFLLMRQNCCVFAQNMLYFQMKFRKDSCIMNRFAYLPACGIHTKGGNLT